MVNHLYKPVWPRLFLLACGLFLLGFIMPQAEIIRSNAVVHPFLIVSESDYTRLQALASNDPWKTMKASAISNAGTLNYRSGNPASMADAVSSNALAFILDPDNRSQYVNKVYQLLLQWEDMLNYSQTNLPKASDSWEYNSPYGTALVNSVLALDIVYNDLSASDRTQAEARIQTYLDWFKVNGSQTAWTPNYTSMLLIWAIYKGNTADATALIPNHRSGVLSQFTSDGIFGSCAYAMARFSSVGSKRRDGKCHMMDVLEHTRADPIYYSNPSLAQFYEWLYGYAFGPFDKVATFGDSPMSQSFETGSTASARAYRFSPLAAAYAAWREHGAGFPGQMLQYVLMGQAPPAPKKPVSRIFWNGFAGFWEENPVGASLYGVLWCPNKALQHTHPETNSMYVAAYGEHVLVNSGYCGQSCNYADPATGLVYYYSNYTAGTALSANTVMVEVKKHARIDGGGITEGFTANGFDYASGFSGEAILYDYHQRNFCFVHPMDGKPGYFMVFDEVTFPDVNRQIFLALHPNADNLTAVTPNTEFNCQIKPRTYSGHPVFLSIFSATPPTSTSIESGSIVMSNQSFIGKYLLNTFQPDGTGQRRAATVLFPYDATHPKANMTRITGAGYTGARIDLGGNVADIAIESAGKTEVAFGNATLQGLALLYRQNAGKTAFYFVRKGRKFWDAKTAQTGFESAADITLYMNNGEGKIISPGASVTFYDATATDIYLTTGLLTPQARGPGWIKVNVPAGSFGIAFNHMPQIKTSQAAPELAPVMNVAGKFFAGGIARFDLQLKSPGAFDLFVCDVLGKVVWKYHGQSAQRRVSLAWDGKSKTISRGIYFLRLEQGKNRVSGHCVSMQ